jgi:phosphoribosylamine-glycine ligase
VVVVNDYLDGYVQALTNVLDELDVVDVGTISDFKRMIQEMIDDCGSE